MAAKDQAKKAGKTAKKVRKNPYLQRIAEDAELRDNVRNAYDAARSAYGRLSNGKAPAAALVSDRKLQKELKEAAHSLRVAGEALKDGPKRKGKLGRKLGILIIGAGIAIATNEGLRKKVLDALFGAEEEFEYTSTTSPASTPNSGSGSTPGAGTGSGTQETPKSDGKAGVESAPSSKAGGDSKPSGSNGETAGSTSTPKPASGSSSPGI